jgi:hypothetical protein
VSDNQRETAFLRQCLLYDDTGERHKLEESVTQLQCNERCVRRAVWLMALLVALAMAGLFYSVVVLADDAQSMSQFVARFTSKAFCALGLGSLICLLAFVGLGAVYRKELEQRREECRRLTTRLLESRLGKPLRDAVTWDSRRTDSKQRNIKTKGPNVNTKHSGMIETVRDGIIAAIKGTGDIVHATVDTITKMLATTIKDTGKVGTSVTDAIADVASGAIRGAAQIGADLTQAAKGIMVGVLRGTRVAGTEVMDTISHTAHVAIRDTAEVGGDLEAAATGLVQGAIEGAKEMGVSAEDAASAAANGALKAADKVGAKAVETVRKAVTKPVNGVKAALKEPALVLSKN